MIEQQYITVNEALDLNKVLSPKVIPTENRVLIFSPNGESTTKSGLIISSTVKEGKPRKGVVIRIGHIDIDHADFFRNINIGVIVTYGLYAGKEVEFNPEWFNETQAELIKGGVFTVLDLNEIILIETNSYEK